MTNGNQTITPIYDKQRVGRGIAESLGLTKREYFAAMAMQGFISNPKVSESESSGKQLRDKMAEASVLCADALIEALNNQPK